MTIAAYAVGIIIILVGLAAIAAAIVGGQVERARRRAIGETVDRVLSERWAWEQEQRQAAFAAAMHRTEARAAALARARELACPDHDATEVPHAR